MSTRVVKKFEDVSEESKTHYVAGMFWVMSMCGFPIGTQWLIGPYLPSTLLWAAGVFVWIIALGRDKGIMRGIDFTRWLCKKFPPERRKK